MPESATDRSLDESREEVEDRSATPEEAERDTPERLTLRAAVLGLWLRVRSHKRASLALAVLLALALAAGAAFFLRQSAVPDGTVAEIGDQRISTEQLDKRVDALEALYGLKKPTGGKALDTFRRDAAKSAVVSILIEQAAEDRGIAVSDKEVDDILAKLIKERYPDGGQRAFIEALGVMGANEQQVRDELHQQAVVAALFDDVTADVSVSDADVRDAFDDRRDQLATPEQRSLLNIVVSTRAQADAVLKKLRAGADFAAVARASSIDKSTSAAGGKLGVAIRADLDDAYGSAAFAAKAGALFGPVQTSTGWHVGRVEKVVPATPATFAGVEKQLKATLENEGAIKKWRAFLEDLLADSRVRYHVDYRPASPTSLPSDLPAGSSTTTK